MVEFAIVLNVARICQKRNLPNLTKNKYITNEPNNTKNAMNKTNSINNLEAQSPFVSENEVFSESQGKWYSATDVIDFAAFFIFFCSFVIFNLAYMSYHL